MRNADKRFTATGITDATEIIMLKYAPILENAIHSAKVRMGVHHRHRLSPKWNRVKITKKGGVIQVMSIGTTKGEILGAHKGVGGTGQANRIAKPFINEPASKILREMADDITSTTGDILAYALVR